MNKRFKDDNGEYHGESQPIITLTPDSAVHSNPPDSKHQGDSKHQVQVRSPQGGPTPLSVEETVEVLGELDKLTAQVQELTGKIRELTKELESKDGEIAQLKAKSAADASASETMPPPPSSEATAADGDAQNRDKDKEIADLKDKYLRTLAEHENARRRIRQQSEDSVKLQKENLLRDLLPIVDNLERAVEAAKGKGDGKSIVEGVRMVLTSLLDFLKANGVRPMTSVGQQFDPNRHEAADQVLHSSHPPNMVVEEFHRGYQIGDKVLRPARVVVSKGDGNGKRN